MDYIMVSEDKLAELLRYKALYQNEKSHSDTLQRLLSQLIEKESCISNLDECTACQYKEEDCSDFNNCPSSSDLPEHWTQEQKEDIERALANIANVLINHRMF